MHATEPPVAGQRFVVRPRPAAAVRSRIRQPAPPFGIEIPKRLACGSPGSVIWLGPRRGRGGARRAPEGTASPGGCALALSPCPAMGEGGPGCGVGRRRRGRRGRGGPTCAASARCSGSSRPRVAVPLHDAEPGDSRLVVLAHHEVRVPAGQLSGMFRRRVAALARRNIPARVAASAICAAWSAAALSTGSPVTVSRK